MKLANDKDIVLDEPVLNAIQEICEPDSSKDLFDIHRSPVCALSPNILMDGNKLTYGDVLKQLPNNVDLEEHKGMI